MCGMRIKAMNFFCIMSWTMYKQDEIFFDL
jgi:hypothetical protein